MTERLCSAPIAFADIVDYWSGDLAPAEVDRIDEHVFGCGECARELASADSLARGIAAIARAGRFRGVITDGILNRLSAEGIRIRTFTLDGPGVVPCAVWAGDDLVVSRIRADFTDVQSVTIVSRQASGEEISRISGVAIRPGQREILNAFPAAHLRKLPATRVQVTVTSQVGNSERRIAEYTLEHAGSFDRSGGASSTV